MERRIKWIDVVRCFGIFAVYLGHFSDTGQLTPFLYTHHVPLFFLVSGCLAPRKEQTLAVQIKKTVSGVVFPWFVFAVASAVFYAFYTNCGEYEFLQVVKQIAAGTIVDEYVAASLWFLTCLAGVRILFQVLRKLRYPVVILAVCLGMFWLEAEYSLPRYYNFHRMFRFLFYYAVGFYAFPYLNRALQPQTLRGRILLSASGLFSLGFAALVYFGRDPLAWMRSIPLLGTFSPAIQALVIIWVYLVAAKLLENVEIFNQIGRKTLYLCGSEYFVRQLLKCFVRLFGLDLVYPRPICAWICAVLVLYLAYRYMVPFQERILNSMRSFPAWLRQGQQSASSPQNRT